ncbi:hypothetical protein C7S18_00915 [Ahniella affigens]|uniref:Uncharacterized protein n=1 Tax=Ahniella affigens TaxID=2021234 RepID=A0A2P1PLX9_9GAMM|nr:hypothetical protein [Ahniella affigens]AVP95844.1 hypothetical protein C7S18_00915 [Ahniella affigens]
MTLVGWLTALMITLCLGGLWALLGMLFRADLAAFALVIGASATLAKPYLAGSSPLRSGVVLAVAAWVGMFYAQVLRATMWVAQAFDVPFWDTLSRMGWQMAIDLAWVRLSGLGLGLMLAGTLIAALLGARRRNNQ